MFLCSIFLCLDSQVQTLKFYLHDGFLSKSVDIYHQSNAEIRIQRFRTPFILCVEPGVLILLVNSCRGFLIHKYFWSNNLVLVLLPLKLEIDLRGESRGDFTDV